MYKENCFWAEPKVSTVKTPKQPTRIFLSFTQKNVTFCGLSKSFNRFFFTLRFYRIKSELTISKL